MPARRRRVGTRPLRRVNGAITRSIWPGHVSLAMFSTAALSIASAASRQSWFTTWINIIRILAVASAAYGDAARDGREVRAECDTGELRHTCT